MKFELILGMSVPTLLLFFSSVFAFLWFQERCKTHVLAMSVGFLLAFFGFVLSQLIIEKDSVFNVLFAQPLLLGAIGTAVTAVCKRSAIEPPIRSLVAIGIVGIAISCWATLQFETLNLRSLSNNLTLCSFFAAGGICLFRANLTKKIDKLLCLSFFATASYLGGLGLVALLVDPTINGNSYHQSIYWIAMNTVGTASILSFSALLVTAFVSDTMSAAVAAAQLDKLTGLKTRRAFDEAVEDALSKLDRMPLPVSLVVGDIDHFKSVNDKYGHQTGDGVIQLFGEIIGSRVRGGDVAGRVGGEEFAVLLWNTSASGAVLFAEAIRTSFMVATSNETGSGLNLSASFGVAELQKGESFDHLYERADEALYRAKNAGRNRVVLSEHRTFGAQLNAA